MAIYGRWGNKVQIVRRAKAKDFQALDNHKPNKLERAGLSIGSFWVVRGEDDEKERLYHLAFLRADGAFAEIADRCRELDPEWGR